MAEPLHVLILNALVAHLTTPALSGSPAIAYPLVAFTPTHPTPYLAAHPILRAEPEHFGLTFTNSDLHRGVFQVDAVMPDGAGEAPGIRLASLVAERFAIGTSLALAAGTLKVQILNPPTIAAAVKDAPWVRLPVSIPYLVIT